MIISCDFRPASSLINHNSLGVLNPAAKQLHTKKILASRMMLVEADYLICFASIRQDPKFVGIIGRLSVEIDADDRQNKCGIYFVTRRVGSGHINNNSVFSFCKINIKIFNLYLHLIYLKRIRCKYNILSQLETLEISFCDYIQRDNDLHNRTISELVTLRG